MSKCQDVRSDGDKNIKIKRRRKTSSDTSQSLRAPKRKSQKPVLNSIRNINSERTETATKAMETYEQSRKIIELQEKLNTMLQYLADPIPDILRRVGTTFITSDRTYHASDGVLLKFLMQAAIREIPTRTTPVRLTIY